MSIETQNHIRSQILGLWSIQDALLQQYRLVFIATETILVSAAALISTAPRHWMYLLFGISFVVIFAWVFVCKHRGDCVAFTQWMLLRAEKDIFLIPPVSQAGVIRIDISRPVNAFKEFQEIYGNKKNNPQYMAILNSDQSSDLFKSLAKSITRKIFEVCAPVFFGIIWILIFLKTYSVIK